MFDRKNVHIYNKKGDATATQSNSVTKTHNYNNKKTEASISTLDDHNGKKSGKNRKASDEGHYKNA